ncbi:Bowman-Birk type wound-induced proteinase inhibitor WIP1-like [Lolium rigidum]|uniref:Bowman-Birk type wound-induced proteinase inhibitor WIP1-like n=1 Tax=Lolium rigidum TaxID=89674 RepID=UPI001F5D7588|nr:Bowman-Birk type wound-induced proteinase inhibitor WIP1-like [Lolium rigidum]XP_051190866.1 Bowman-Birk type wound-induced proteinase inhibitor WIP1-like [Lolium perenne]
MKSSTVMVIVLLQTVLVMGILAEVNAQGYFPKCCNNCRSFSGAMFCDDVMYKCPPTCAWCRAVQVRPVKTFRCADGRTADGSCHPCKNH